MNRIALSVLISLLLTGGVLGVALFLPNGTAGDRRGGEIAPRDVPAPRVEEAIAGLSARIDLLAEALHAAPRQEQRLEPAAAVVAGAESILERLLAIEKMLARSRNTDDELAAARLREERESRLQAEDGYIAADELFAEKKFALAGSGYLRFLELHPSHPDARDLLRKARDAFQSAGYTEKAFWVHREMMKKFPDNWGEDLMALAQMEKDARRFDEAIQHAEEAAEAARIEEDRLWRLMYRAWFVQLRDGDAAGLQAYRDLGQLTESLGMGDKGPGRKLKVKIAEIEERLAQGR